MQVSSLVIKSSAYQSTLQGDAIFTVFSVNQALRHRLEENQSELNQCSKYKTHASRTSVFKILALVSINDYYRKYHSYLNQVIIEKSERNNKHGELSKEYLEAHLAKNKILSCV